MKILNQFGWNSFHQQNIIKLNTDLSIGRVISIKGFKYYLITESGELETELSGKLLYETENESLPKVGDWVLYKDYDSTGYVISLLPRMNLLTRKEPGNKTQRQGLAANIDKALIVQGLDRDFNVMRLERYIVQLMACDIDPVIILNKCDLVENLDEYRTQVEKLGRNARIHFCSSLTGKGIDDLLSQILERNKTYILIGSSGVGKSSLLNVLMKEDRQTIGGISDFNNKGKHTTTSRDLFRLSNGSLIIDTPGMREFGVTFEEGQSANDLFPTIQKFATRCKFSDCTHLQEAGCGVLEAWESGELQPEVYDSYVKLVKEQKRFQINIEDKKRLGKQSGKMSREANAYRKKYKY